MAKKSKQSRFGNPAKAAADVAARANAMSLRDARLDRAMEALSPGFALWLESQGSDDAGIDMSLMNLDDFFDMYRILEPQTDAMSLAPEAVGQVLDAATAASPQSTFALRSAVRDYVGYLAQASLWTGTHGELEELAELFKQPAWPGLDPTPNRDALVPPLEGAGNDDLLERDSATDGDLVDPEDYDFPEVYVPELTAELVAATVDGSPLWKNIESILAWVGGGRDVTTKGALRKKNRAEAAAALTHSGAGILDEAIRSSATPAELEAETLNRLKLYWYLLSSLGLIKFDAGRAVLPSHIKERLEFEESRLELFRDVLGQFIFISTLAGSEPGSYTGWHVDMASFMAECATENPPESALLVHALESPETVHPDLYILAKNVASWAAEGLVAVDDHVTVPPAFRPDLVEMLKEDFPVKAVGPGAGLDLAELRSAG
ncbi:hypothetical protein CVV68_00785 [Arthrobacter livingstonensis]|uniref:Uncharacterized protein n=1 Tax=Arthrobacter livingstonensis TaxID=670078 RepID=A0A2V5LDX1_9MICC|nr:hypothetical protein [Arthrobacter livingstonensis]PYI69678.1 hypothetical protein CVV68_00785 [Arthrobacter livingstonensis]